ncbi:hypothetical protein PHAMO_290066 [Magnetospirillum molischianum DSM 120]|uniref:Uncharacterized protein n=1 Tax=Magnetospirillum molischianum DSM 120 TaxID=1150626 RepID=H8FTS1_MAGML|nr:hypothetical protein PHAMO_290066 [Magnetospirillum molischianum DSM 120]
MWPHSTVPAWTVSRTWRPGTSSPAAKLRIWNLPSVASATRRVMYSPVPNRVSRLLGKLDASRHLISGWVWASAGAAKALAAAPKVAVVRKVRRSIERLLDFVVPGQSGSPRFKRALSYRIARAPPAEALDGRGGRGLSLVPVVICPTGLRPR